MPESYDLLKFSNDAKDLPCERYQYTVYLFA